MKPTFLGHTKPLLVDMIIVETPTDCVIHTRKALYEGAEAFGVQMERIKPEYRKEETLKKMFSYMGDKPLYVTNYRGGYNKEMTDEERMEGLKFYLKCGATLVDIMGDTFDPTPGEMTKNPIAIDRQKKLIEEIHEMGGEVLMSSHILKYLPEEQVLEIALEQQSRGADIVKFVTGAANEDEMFSNLEITRRLKKELKVPFLFLSSGPYCRMHRIMGPYLGSCMWLCVDEYAAFSSREQPLLSATADVVRKLDFMPTIRPFE